MAVYVQLEISVNLVFVAVILMVSVFKAMVKPVAKTHNVPVVTAPLKKFVFQTREEVVN